MHRTMDNQNSKTEQVNVLLSGEDAETFTAYMKEEVIQTKASAGLKLIVEGLRRWQKERLHAERMAS